MHILVWFGFLALILALLALDLGVFHRRAHVLRVREALKWTAFWIGLGLLFNVAVYFLYEHHLLGMGVHVGHDLGGRRAAIEFLTGYLLEKSLSLDNIFVIALIFTHFRVPLRLQHRVLFWGILGALVLRGGMIGLGATLIARFAWMNYVFGGILILTALRMLFSSEHYVEPDRNLLVRFARRFYPVTSGYEEQTFSVRTAEGTRAITPLLLVLLVIESSDVLFAVDSIPAVFAVTRDPFIVFSSNVFAILGLRSLYFVLAGVIETFRYLRVSLVVLLGFVGMKMIVAEYVEIPTLLSLGLIAGILTVGIGASIWVARREASQDSEPPAPGEGGTTSTPSKPPA